MEVKQVKLNRDEPLKKVNENGYDEDGVLHGKCGTPDCCGTCETAEEEQVNDKTNS